MPTLAQVNLKRIQRVTEIAYVATAVPGWGIGVVNLQSGDL